jgi:hypothetical protein
MLKLDQKKNNHAVWQSRIVLSRRRIEVGYNCNGLWKNEVYAGRIKDSTGAYTQFPNFTRYQCDWTGFYSF